MLNFILAGVIIILFVFAGSMWMERNVYRMLYQDYSELCAVAEEVLNDIAREYPGGMRNVAYRQWSHDIKQLRDTMEDNQ